jgi:hypothetical protein
LTCPSSKPGFNKLQSAEGVNPFDNLAFTVDGEQRRFKEYMQSGWQFARDVGSMPLSDVAYNLSGKINHAFANTISDLRLASQ